MRRVVRYFVRLVIALLLLVGLYFAACLIWLSWRESESAIVGAPRGGAFVQAGATSVYSQEFNPGGTRGTVLLVHGTGAWSGTWSGTCHASKAKEKET